MINNSFCNSSTKKRSLDFFIIKAYPSNDKEYIRTRYGETIHITRMFPKRFEEILNGGSIYWVIKGKLCVRQEILKIERFVDNDNVKRCRIDLKRDLILTVPFKERPNSYLHLFFKAATNLAALQLGVARGKHLGDFLSFIA